MIPSSWPGIRVFAQEAGEVHPYDPSSAGLFRGEEAFAANVIGWQRWNKPSPEPYFDEAFHALVIQEIKQRARMIAKLVYRVADAMHEMTDAPPLLVAILRAGVPVAALLARQLACLFHAEVPVVALSLFYELSWDTTALAAALKSYPGRPVWFVDGWTGRGRVAQELHNSYHRWLADGYADFTQGKTPRLAVLCDPGGFASISGTRNDVFIPSACFTAPEVLGFSRGFVKSKTGMFSVYRYPARLTQPAYHTAWLSIGAKVDDGEHDLQDNQATQPIPIRSNLPGCLADCHADDAMRSRLQQAPASYRLLVNEVARALINRKPLEILFRDDEATVAEKLAPIVYLCRLQKVPVRYEQTKLDDWGCLAAARMRAQ